MENEGLFIESPVPSATMIVKTLWVVNADETYNVSKRNRHVKTYTLIRTLKGNGHITLKDNQNFFPSANSILLIRSREIHNYYTESSPWEFSWFEFFGVPPLPLNTVVQQPFSNTELILQEELKKRMRQPGSENSAAASAILTSLVHIWSTDIETASSKQRIKVHKLIEFMHQNLKNNISVTEMAEATEMSERGLRKMFTNTTGTTPQKYYDQLRMEYARELMRSGQYNVFQTSVLLKYSSAFSFSTAFKNTIGTSPSNYMIKCS